MSFLVAINGQFLPLSYERETTLVSPVTSPKKTADSSEFKKILQGESADTHPPQSKLSIYQKNAKNYQDQKRREHARDIMSSPVKHLSTEEPAVEALDLFKKYGFRHMPIIKDENIIVGMISERELLGNLQGKLCRDVMVNKVIVCDEMASVNEIAIILLREKINALPIINHRHELTGIITLSDILAYVIKSTPFFSRA
jgi:CBS domain-containing protein